MDNSAKDKQVNHTHPVSWKQWKKEKREETKKWKEIRSVKRLKRSEKSTTNHVDEQQSNNELQIENGRKYTVSIALPGSILDNAQSPELKTYLAGQIARAASVFNIDEIVVFDEYGILKDTDDIDDMSLKLNKKHHGCTQLVRILQFLECPQYLRKSFFPLHKDLEYAGLLNPLDAPHHLRVDDDSKYREGVVSNKPVKEGKGSFVYIGLQKLAIIDKPLAPNIRVTVELDEQQTTKKFIKGKAVSPSTPLKKSGLYWGYQVRLAKSFGAVFGESPYKEGYDVIIGTSEKGQSVDTFSMPNFKHLLMVFGGLQGIEACIEADEAFKISDPNLLFHHYLNTCPSQGSRTIRTEEAILITLSVLRPQILQVRATAAMSTS